MNSSSKSVLLVDDDLDIHRLINAMLADAGYHVQGVYSGGAALDALREGFRGVILLDVRLPDVNGPEVFKALRTLTPENPVIFMTSHPTMDLALSSILDGAFEFIEKPRLAERLLPVVSQAFESAADVTRGDGSADEERTFRSVVTQSTSMRALFRALQNAVGSSAPVLLRGESGTGKALLARAFHQNSPRRGRPFVALSCAGLSEARLTAELFGEPPDSAHPTAGRLEQARGGTLLLDEIAELPLPFQAKLLRLVQQLCDERTEDPTDPTLDIRLLVSSNQDLERAVTEGRLREDLYYRLAGFTLHLPPLRERVGDIPLLAQHFLKRSATYAGKTIEGFEPRAMALLESYTYPGNVRELENIIAYAVVASLGPEITLAALPPHFLRAARDRQRTPAPQAEGPMATEDFPTLQDMERRHIASAVALSNNNKAQAARILGISRMTLYRKLREGGDD